MKKIIFFILIMAFVGAGCDTALTSQNLNLSNSTPYNTVNYTNQTPINSYAKPSTYTKQNTYTPPLDAPNGTYNNVYGNEVPRPYYAPSQPAGASAQCRDGTYSFSQSRRGTCSGHGGVDEWL